MLLAFLRQSSHFGSSFDYWLFICLLYSETEPGEASRAGPAKYFRFFYYLVFICLLYIYIYI